MENAEEHRLRVSPDIELFHSINSKEPFMNSRSIVCRCMIVAAAIVTATVPMLQAQLPSLTTTNSKKIVPKNILNFLPYHFGLPEGMTHDQLRDITMKGLDDSVLQGLRFAHTQIFYNDSSTWQQAHKATIQYFEAIRLLPYTVWVYQEIAQDMLRDYLLHQPLTAELQQTIEYYFNILLQYRNHHQYETVGKSLLSLKGYWSDEKIEQIAKKVIEFGLPPAVVPDLVETLLTRNARFESGIGLGEKHAKALEAFERVSKAERADRVEKLRAIYEEYILSYPNKELSPMSDIQWGQTKDAYLSSDAYLTSQKRWQGIIAVLSQGKVRKKQ